MRVKRALCVLSAILLQCVGAFGAETVTVQPAMVSMVPTLARLHESCAVEGEFDGCTRFVAYRLSAICVSSQIHASVTFRPWILLYNIQRLPHEHLHIGDVRRLAAAYVAEIEQLTFGSPAQCQAEALHAVDGFGDKMFEFALRSNLERHPKLKRAWARSHPDEILLARR